MIDESEKLNYCEFSVLWDVLTKILDKTFDLDKLSVAERSFLNAAYKKITTQRLDMEFQFNRSIKQLKEVRHEHSKI